jgi:hypothetical protein
MPNIRLLIYNPALQHTTKQVPCGIFSWETIHIRYYNIKILHIVLKICFHSCLFVLARVLSGCLEPVRSECFSAVLCGSSQVR